MKEGKVYSPVQQSINAAKAAGIQAIDSVFSDIEDMESLRARCKMKRKALGI
jgi:citrate lyase beta subunit